MAVDEHLRFIRLQAADDDRRIGLRTKFLHDDVGNALQYIVDLRVGDLRELFTAHV